MKHNIIKRAMSDLQIKFRYEVAKYPCRIYIQILNSNFISEYDYDDETNDFAYYDYIYLSRQKLHNKKELIKCKNMSAIKRILKALQYNKIQIDKDGEYYIHYDNFNKDLDEY